MKIIANPCGASACAYLQENFRKGRGNNNSLICKLKKRAIEMLATNSGPHLPILLLIKKRIRVDDSKFHATGQFLSRALKENISIGEGA